MMLIINPQENRGLVISDIPGRISMLEKYLKINSSSRRHYTQ